MTHLGGGADQPLRILIADDHALFRRGIRDVLEDEPDLRVVAEATDGEDAVQQAQALWPHGLDLVLMDITMPRLDGIAATKQLLAETPGLPVIVLTASAEDHDLIAAAQAGAVGFLSKSLSPAAIVRAIRKFQHEGELPMSPAMAAKVLRHFQQLTSGMAGACADQPADNGLGATGLTAREQEVLELLAAGSQDREIGERLVVSEHTVKKHVQHILRKLGVRNRTEAVVWLHRRTR